MSKSPKFSRLLCALSVPMFLMLGIVPAQAAGGEMPSLVHDIGFSLMLAGVLAVVFTRLKIPAIAGFLAAGIIAGPQVLGQVTDSANIDTIAQLGFIFLLFMIGLEIDVAKIRASGKAIIVTGLLQFPLSMFFGAGVVNLLLMAGFGQGVIGEYAYSAIYIGIFMAMSSTLLVIKLFQDHFELDTEPGRIALGLLIFQDIWAIVVILMQPNFDNPQIFPILMSFVGIGVLLLITVGLSRYLAAVGFGWISKVPEIIQVAAIGWCFMVVFLGLSLDSITETVFGVNLHLSVSSGMAALIAGATIANLPFSTEIVTKVGSVKDFFITLFFIGLGMSIPIPASWEVPIYAVFLAGLAILSRQFIFFPLLWLTGVDQRNAQVSSIRLAQISEFGLVIAYLAIQNNHISPELSAAVIFAFVLTALVSPALYSHAYPIHRVMQPLLSSIGFKAPPDHVGEQETTYALALLGFHRVASSLLFDLERMDKDLVEKTLVVDFNVANHPAIAASGATVKYGDLSNHETLLHAGIDKARVILCTVQDDQLRGITNKKLVGAVRRLNTEALIIANAIDLSAVPKLYAAGADYVFLSRTDTARALIPIVEGALAGTLDIHRDEQDRDLATRKEVMD